MVDFGVPAEPWARLKESEKRYKYIDLATEIKETVEHEGDSDTNSNWCTRYNP